MKEILSYLSVLLSIVLLISVSFDVLTEADPLMSRLTYYSVCLLLLADFFALMFLEQDKKAFWRRQWPLLVSSFPFLLIAELMFASVDPALYHALHFLPLIRGFFSIYIIVGWYVKNLGSRVLVSYFFISCCVVYFSSLLFFSFEREVNPAVHDYYDALWWASMNFTTIGSNIIASSVVGKILGVIMGFCGMMMLPVFTAFFTGQVAKARGV